MGKCTNDFHDSKVHIRCSVCMESFLSSIAQDVCIMRLQAICHVVDLAVGPPPKYTYPIYPVHYGRQLYIKWVDVCLKSFYPIYQG